MKNVSNEWKIIMDNKIVIKLISMEDLIQAGCVNFPDIIEIIKQTLLDYKNGNIYLPEKTSLIFDREIQNRINCMPSYLKNKNVCGVKWVSVFPNNPYINNVPNVSGAVILSDTRTGFPYAFMDGTLITALRTASMGALAAKCLARNESRVYCSIGTGEQAKMHFVAINNVLPSIQTCYVASKTQYEEEEFINKMKALFPKIKYISCKSDYSKASSCADVIVTAVSCQKPLLKAKDIQNGAFYCHVGGWEDEYDVPRKAEKIICDDWNSLKHRGSPTIARMFSEGLLSDKDIYANLADILDETKHGRENDSEFIYFNSIGLSCIDVATAQYCFQKVEDKGLGLNWTIKSKDIFSSCFS